MSHLDALKSYHMDSINQYDRVRRIRNYVDLQVGKLTAVVNHSVGTVDFSFPVINVGDLPAKGPFSIVVGVSYKVHDGSSNTIPQSFTQEAVYTFAYYNEIAGNSTFPTPPITAHLGYINISNANIYEIEIIIDSEMQVAEASESNNRTIIRWFTTTPPPSSKSRSGEALNAPPVAVLSRQTIDSKEVSSKGFSIESPNNKRRANC